MPTHYDGTPEERRALDLFIKLARCGEAFFARTTSPILEAGLTPSQFGVLETLYHLGALMPSQLAEKHLKSRNNLSVVIDHLERDGLVRREKCAGDRRAQWIHLTDAGRERITAVLPKYVATTVQECAALTADEQEQLAGLLKKLGRGAG
jgi:MarR family 2-MHQ and catechol resistance regulon transcriptional repressor